MSAPRTDPNDPGEWLRRARSNLARAAAGPPGPQVLYEDLAFDAQQAAEKAVKAVLVAARIPFPKVHSLEYLLDLAESDRIVVPGELRSAARLTRFATVTRYPGVEDVTEEEYRAALEIAEQVVEWAEEIVGQATD